MREGWGRTKLDELTEVDSPITYGVVKPGVEGNVLFIRGGDLAFGIVREDRLRTISDDVSEQYKRTILRGGELLISLVGTPGQVAIVPQSLAGANIARQVGLIRLVPSINKWFVSYYLQSPQGLEALGAQTSGSVQQVINLRALKTVQIPLPPIPEQKRIVAILDEAFQGIDAAIANTQKNLTNARELFESYLNDVFTKMGEGWDENILGDVCETITKGSSPKWQGISYIEKPGILFVTSENVGQNRMIMDKRKYVEEAFNEKDKKSILKHGDVLTNIVGASIGRTAIFDQNEIANINQAVCLIRPFADKLYNKFLSYLLNSPYFKVILHENEIDNARANLSLGFFKGLTIPMPSLEIQKGVVEQLEVYEEQAIRLESNYQQKLNSLNELKQSLLAKAFSGELTAQPEQVLKEAVG